MNEYIEMRERPAKTVRGEVITVGNELISGESRDVNGWFVARTLTSSGLEVTRISAVGDDPEGLSRVLREAVAASRFVIVMGGLGTTEDDRTNEIAARMLDRPLCLNRQMYQAIERWIASRGMKMSGALEKMAWMPEGSVMLDPGGKACGYLLVDAGVRMYFLPGVPDQVRELMDAFVLPDILAQCESQPCLGRRLLKVYGPGEEGIADILKGFSEKAGPVHLGIYLEFPEIHLMLSLRGEYGPGLARELDRTEAEIRHLLGPFIFATGDQSMEGLVGEKLQERGATISVAESCTGGLIGHTLTNVPGSSRYFQGGMIVYSDRSKVDLLGVSPETLRKYGAVSDQTVREMAAGVRKRMNTDLGLAVTGIAGPEGGTKEKPVGTVHIGLAVPDRTFSGRFRFWGTREKIKQQTSMMALDCTRRYLHGYPFLSGL